MISNPELLWQLNLLKCDRTQEQISDHQDADADIAEDEGEDGAKHVLELLPRGLFFGRWAGFEPVGLRRRQTGGSLKGKGVNTVDVVWANIFARSETGFKKMCFNMKLECFYAKNMKLFK